jgi:hypothetical protein
VEVQGGLLSVKRSTQDSAAEVEGKERERT